MRDFLKYTLASLLGLFIFCGLGIGGLLFLIISAAVSNPGPQVQDKSILTLDLSMDISDTEPASSTSQAIGEALSGGGSNVIPLRVVLEAINQAAKDDRIVGLYLQGSSNPSSSGLATLKEVRKALEDFRTDGKPIIAYDVNWREREYYLASVANTVILNPFGAVEINGFSSEEAFFTGALQKYGVNVQVTRVGKYKAAVEPFLLKRRSPENQQQTRQLLNDLWNEFTTTASKERKLRPQQLKAIANNQGILMASEAKQAQLVDKVAYFDEVVADLKKLTENDAEDRTFRQINIRTYAETVDLSLGRSSNQIAVVYANGEIVDGPGGVRDVGGDTLARQLRRLRLDEDVKAVVLRVNSPGGSVTASEVIQREVILTRKAKPVIVSMGDVAASGGYWISTYADRIFAEPNTITGSIGVFGLMLNVKQLANNQGVTWDTVKTSRYADSSTITRPKTAQELALHQRIVDEVYDRFITKVADSRKLSKAKVAQLAQGRVWSGTTAKQLGLVDEIGGVQAAIEAAAKQAKLGDNWSVQEYPEIDTFEERLVRKLFGAKVEQEAPRLDPLTAQLFRLKDDISVLRSFNDPLNVYVRMPYTIRVD